MKIPRAVCLISLLLLVLLVVSFQSGPEAGANTFQATSLCTKGEKVVFSCALKSSTKIVSLCSSEKLTKTDGHLQYRFGLPGKIELEYPKDRARPEQAFHYNHYFRARVDLTEISFSIDGYSYTVFDSYNGEEKPPISEEGLTVTRPNSEKDVTYICRGRAKVDFGSVSEVLVNDSSPEQR
jgi:hypothetical protein